MVNLQDVRLARSRACYLSKGLGPLEDHSQATAGASYSWACWGPTYCSDQVLLGTVNPALEAHLH